MLFRQMKKIFKKKQHMKILQTCEKLSTISKFSNEKNDKKMKIKTSSKKFEKTICSNITSMNKLNDTKKRFSCFKFSIFCNSKSIMKRCSFFKKSICFNKRCCLTIVFCCATSVFRNFICNCFRFSKKRCHFLIFNEIKS